MGGNLQVPTAAYGPAPPLEVEVPIAIEVVENLNVDNAGAHDLRRGRKKRTAEELSSDNHAENKIKKIFLQGLREELKRVKKALQAALSQNKKLHSQLRQPPIPNIDENQLTENMDTEVVEQQLFKIGGFFVSGKVVMNIA